MTDLELQTVFPSNPECIRYIIFLMSCLDSCYIASVSLLRTALYLCKTILSCHLTLNGNRRQHACFLRIASPPEFLMLVSFTNIFFFNLCVLVTPSLNITLTNLLKVDVTTLAYFKHSALFKGAYLNEHKLYCGCLFSSVGLGRLLVRLVSMIRLHSRLCI